MMPGPTAFDGGLALKAGQTLIGQREGRNLPAITNTTAARNGGNGIVLADSVRVSNVRVEHTHASGIFGTDVTGVAISDVQVIGANRSAARTSTSLRLWEVLCREAPVPSSECVPLPHGGIVLLFSRPGSSSTAMITHSAIRDAAGIGVAAVAWRGARHRLVMADTHVEGGAGVVIHDVGVMGMAEGVSSDVRLELNHVRVLGRMSPGGRNVIVYASADASASASIDGSYVGNSGQDGVIAVAALLPATAELDIRNSTIENAAQTNVEGTLLALPPIDSARVSESRISISLTSSTIRNAGAVPGFEQNNSNILLVGSRVTREPQPIPRGRYWLAVRNSTIEKAKQLGIRIGGEAVDASEFDVLLRDSRVSESGSAEFSIGAPNVRIDARRNCWGDEAGLRESRIVRNQNGAGVRVDASEPITCAGLRARP